MSLMPYRRSVFEKENFYHIYNRGDRKEPIFTTNRDYQRFLEKAEEYKSKYTVDVVAYCLLSNHFHLLLKQLTKVPLSKFVGVLLNSHSHYVSKKYELPLGHLFQGRFGCRLIESNEDFLNTSRYIHLNPIKKNLLEMDYTYKKSRLLLNRQLILRARNYPWSSYQIYLNQKNFGPLGVNTRYILELEKNQTAYRKFVEAKITDEDIINFEAF